jgi:hypothetical protein
MMEQEPDERSDKVGSTTFGLVHVCYTNVETWRMIQRFTIDSSFPLRGSVSYCSRLRVAAVMMSMLEGDNGRRYGLLVVGGEW